MSKIDWDNAPEWADRVMSSLTKKYFCNAAKFVEVGKESCAPALFGLDSGLWLGDLQIDQMRPESEPVVSALDMELAINKSKYHKEIKKGVLVDTYDVLMAFEVTNPAMQHALKKMLAPGQRGVKDTIQDMKEAIQSIERAIELEQS